MDFSKDVEIVKYSRQIERKLKKVDKERKKYLLDVTGHQGEPKYVLYKIATGVIKFNLYSEDSEIFSCRTIITPIKLENRKD